MATSISHSPAETFAVGETWGKTVHDGQVIALCGDLGAGKTQLVKGLALGLGIAVRVTSPTFALVNTYTGGRLVLFHLDLYRLDGREQILSAGLEEYLHPHGVTVIEWAERWFSEKPRSRGHAPTMSAGRHSPRRVLDPGPIRWVEIDVISESERHIRYEDFGT
jgi:tRNA threonylcarbamoyladenosine biosynthesis protein TsaE